jgi:DNA helicase-2/ATP-dependent DNA helicase PcrA
VKASNYLEHLNEAQRKAVINTDGPSLVIAGAGSGKTRVLTYRIAHLLNSGLKPYRILALTFTNKAAKEMKERIASLIGEEKVRSLWMGTFHSIFAKFLRKEADALGYPANFTIYDTVDSKNIIKSIINELKLDDKIYKPSSVYGRISSAKNDLITASAYENSAQARTEDDKSRKPELYRIYKIYTQRCFSSGAMDFDDLLLKTNILFRDHPAILDQYQRKFDYILVDEYQDTNFSQYLIIKKLAELHKNICVVGDDAQSIYSFRGAKIENILNFQKDYADFKLFKLEQNYRSTKTIVKAANSVIEKNVDRIQKIVFSKKEDGSKIKIIEALTDNEEGFTVINKINDSIFSDATDYQDHAILYRTNAQSRIFEEALRRRNIPYKNLRRPFFLSKKRNQRPVGLLQNCCE